MIAPGYWSAAVYWICPSCGSAHALDAPIIDYARQVFCASCLISQTITVEDCHEPKNRKESA